MSKPIAKLRCIALYDKETQTPPRFCLTYEGEIVGEFHAYNRAAASQVARHLLDHKVFGHAPVRWYQGIDEKRIPYDWENRAMPKTSPTVTEAEWQLIFWQRGSAGSFTAALFNAAACADLTNLARLALGFPDLIAVFRRYSQEPGYWQALQQRTTPTLNPADDLGELNEGE